MKRKLLTLSAVFALLAGAATAQNKTTFGVRAGVNFTNLNGKDESDKKLDMKMKVGFNVGVNAEIPLADEFYLQPGVLFSTKGAKFDGEGDVKMNISYVEVPVNFLYKPELGTGKLLLGVGPYLGIGVGGKIKADEGEADIKFTNDVKDTDDFDGFPMKRLDFGGNLLFGYEFSNKFSVQLNAQLGMANLVPKENGEKPENAKIKNTGFGISVGYRF